MHDVRLLPQARRSLLGRQPAVLYRDRVLTYRQLDERSTRLANALLALGLTRGDRVAIQARKLSGDRGDRMRAVQGRAGQGRAESPLHRRRGVGCVENCTPRVMIAGPGYTRYQRESRGFGCVEHFFAIAGAEGNTVPMKR
jgi:acyl-CoA synthetase (AMP-forming)/AMP-acid ligase II